MKLLLLVVLNSIAWANAQQDSCRDKCLTTDTDPSAPCQCNKACLQFGDCCPDYKDACMSCADRCDATGEDDRLPCQCDSGCVDYGDCCEGYTDVCRASDSSVTDEDLRRVSEELWQADNNSLSENQYSVDRSGSRFFTYVNESALSTPTFSALYNLLDNYNPYVGTPEENTTEHQREQQEFLDAVMETQPMKILHDFLSKKGFANSSVSGFIEELRQYWFMPFTRSDGPLDSSGFEHVFVGEIENGVKGFHGWVQLYEEERAGELTYTEDRGVCPPRVQRMSIRWLNNDKRISSIFIGVSPEYELAVYTLCFVTRSGKFCPTTTEGNSGNIVTFPVPGVSPKTVATTYPDC